MDLGTSLFPSQPSVRVRAAEDSAESIMGAKRYLLDSINITLIFASLQWLHRTNDIEGTVLLNKRERTWAGSFTCLRNPNIRLYGGGGRGRE